MPKSDKQYFQSFICLQSSFCKYGGKEDPTKFRGPLLSPRKLRLYGHNYMRIVLFHGPFGGADDLAPAKFSRKSGKIRGVEKVYLKISAAGGGEQVLIEKVGNNLKC